MPESISIDSLPNTSSVTIKRLKTLGIETYFDLLNYFPYRYENYSIVSTIAGAQPGETVTITGTVVDAKFQITRSGLRIQVFKIADETGEMELGFYNQPYLLRLIKKGARISVAGTVEQYGRKITMKPKEYEILGTDGVKRHTGKIIPVYSQAGGISSKTLREKMQKALQVTQIPEMLPEKIISYNNLKSADFAYRQIHFPSSEDNADAARSRLAFDEMFAIQLSSSLIKRDWEKDSVTHKFKSSAKINKRLADFIGSLPFNLTGSQSDIWGEIFSDLKRTRPMNRFLQGEVGSGKTVIAALACYFAYLNGFRSLIMAPTEILASQHFTTLSGLFKDYPVKIGYHTASNKIEGGDIIVGTQALITKKFKLDKVGLIVVDEQHRFGVAQRAALREKGTNPHLLTMTATPIPRTVVLTMHGELDLSVITEMPKGRKPVRTYLVPAQKRPSGYEWIKKHIRNSGAQVFVVCPLIEESEVETLKSIKASKKEYENLKKIFPDFKLGLLHGKMKSADKEKVMSDFKDHKYDILVTTPVVEVGVDIPNATIMIIEGAERFGLAQLHQLRGRVGRGDKESYCLLFTEKEEAAIGERLSFFSRTNMGTELAEEDLKLRGPGNIYGLRQHGYVDLKIASLTDYQLIQKTKKAAEYFISHFKLKDFPIIERRVAKNRLDKISRD